MSQGSPNDARAFSSSSLARVPAGTDTPNPADTVKALIDGAGEGRCFIAASEERAPGRSTHGAPGGDAPAPALDSQVREQTSLKDGEWYVLAEKKNEITRRTILVFPLVWKGVLLGSQHCAALFFRGVDVALMEPDTHPTVSH